MSTEDKVKAILGIINHLDHYPWLNREYTSELLSIFSDGSDIVRMNNNIREIVMDNPLLFSLYEIDVISPGNVTHSLRYKGNLIHW